MSRLASFGRRLRARLGRRAVILLYHRVASLEVDPWELAVSPRHFDEHLQVVRESATVMPLPDLVRAATAGTAPRRAVAVTFDDGYVDNLHAARPALARRDVPATVFVTTGLLDGTREFWWDELEGLLLVGPLPSSPLELEVHGETRRWALASPGERHGDQPWRAWQQPPGARETAFKEIWSLLQGWNDPARRAALDRIRAWAGRPGGVRPTHRIMTPADLAALVEGGLVVVGAHTVTHSRLSALPPALQRQELNDSRAQLEAIVGTPVTTMSYPFGGELDYTAATVSLARELGFALACANVPGPIRTGDDHYRLRRCFVPDVDGDRFQEMLQTWFEAA